MDEVVPGLFIGDLPEDCPTAQVGAHLCVLQAPCGRGEHIQIVHETREHELVASRKALRKVARWIDTQLKAGKTVLVHCGHGAERSPLAVTFYLHHIRGLSMEEAWQVVSKARPQAQDRRYWIRGQIE